MVAPDATDEQLEKALKIADAWEFVCALPQGIETELSEKGSNLSEGQRQRIAIARAVLRNAPILILDEATSALDAETERRVLTQLMQSDPNRICIITTHRESMLGYADRVYEIIGGEMNQK
jgi:ABC-type bacteriocin/lantibiotic exporter with double-glycine peptidase domain